VGVLEETADQVADLRPRRLSLPHEWGVHVRAAIFGMLDVALSLQDSNGGQNGVVGQPGLLG